MSPIPPMHQVRHSESFGDTSTPKAFQQTKNVVADTLRPMVVVLGVVTLSFIAFWLVPRVRLQWNRRVTLNSASSTGIYEETYLLSPSGIEVYESDISIDMIAEDGQTQSSCTEFDDLSENGDLETIVSSASVTRLNFRVDSLPSIMQGGILERRGRKDMLCDTSAYYEFDTIATGTGPLSAAQETKKSVTRPIFGFNFQEITPPVGSPLWNRKVDIPRTIGPGPLTHPPQLA